MEPQESILDTTKKVLGVSPDYEEFDLDIITHINSALSVINQIGVGPAECFTIQDRQAKWADIGVPINQLQLVKTYLYLKTRMGFDPPGTSFLLNAMENQITEHEVRLSYLSSPYEGN